MHVAIHIQGRCALCAFRPSIWTSISSQGGRGKRYIVIQRFRRRPQNDASNPHDVSRIIDPPRPLQAETSSPQEESPSVRAGSPQIHAENKFRITRDGGQKFASGRLEKLPYAIFTKLIMEQWSSVRNSLSYWPTASSDFQAWGIKSQLVSNRWLAKFQKRLESECESALELRPEEDASPLIIKLRTAFLVGDIKGMTTALKLAFEVFLFEQRFSNVALETQRSLADLRYPLEWFPGTRSMQRKIHLHVGPTNSGKTYWALQRLEQAKTGVYAGPLRLLAHEVYTRLNAKNKLCALITGEERRVPEGQEEYLTSCTVEMVNLENRIDVAVIDEIQMMGDAHRGWAWTQAFLGVKADEVHLCGEARTVPLIRQLCAMTGDSLQVHEYKRLSPLMTSKSSLKGDLSLLEKGDAVILFSRVGIHGMKNTIEKISGRRCAVVYGSLPPETRAQQAKLFNNPNNDYDFLASSDAVGMGLNLNIKRIVFESTVKRTDQGHEALQISDIKQIAGRAGRYRTAHQAVSESLSLGAEASSLEYSMKLDGVQEKRPDTVGFVTTLHDRDMPTLQRAMSSDAAPLATAGITPPDHVLFRFATYFPEGTPLSYILLRLHEISTINSLFHLCRLKDQLDIADAIHEYDLTLLDRLVFMRSPANFRREGVQSVIKALAKCVADQSGGELLDIKEIDLNLLDEFVDVHNKDYLRRLEDLHYMLTLYLWLSYRYAGVFRSQALAFHVKALLEEKMEVVLSKVQIDLRRWKTVLKNEAVSSIISPSPNVNQSGEEKHDMQDPSQAPISPGWERNDHQSVLA